MSRKVTGRIYHIDGTAWASGAVGFALIEPFETGTGVNAAETHTETTDTNGDFSITLATPPTGTAHYRVSTPEKLSYEFYIATGPDTDLQTILTLATTSVAQDAAQTLIDAASVLHIASPTTTYPVASGIDYVRADGTFTVTLPAAIGSGRLICVKNVGVGTITLAAAGTETIDGSASTIAIATLELRTVVDIASGAWDRIGN